MKYLVQAILIDNMGNNTIETVTDSFRTDFEIKKRKHIAYNIV